MDEKYQQGAIRDVISFMLIATRSDGTKNVPSNAEDTTNVPIWLTNDGLECRKAKLTYSELSAEVMSAYTEAITIANLPDKAD